MKSISVFSPAKLNLFLAVTGRRADGFHELVSLAAPLDWGDRVIVEASVPSGRDGPVSASRGGITVEGGGAEVPGDERNLAVRAAKAFRDATGWGDSVHVTLEKRIPVGAGLGGGSSNAAATLQGLNSLAGEPLGAAALSRLAAQVGSDCPLFLHGGPVVMRGRGEVIQPVTAPAALGRLRGRRVMVIHPGFGIRTVDAYAALASAEPGAYLPPAEAEALLAAWLTGDRPAEELLFNSFERVIFAKYLALPALLCRLRTLFGVSALMTGSGSACFALLPRDAPVPGDMERVVCECWGPSAFVASAAIA